METERSEIIRPDNFIEWSLRTIRSLLCSETTEISKELIVNYALRYFVAFIYPETVTQNLSLNRIEEIYSNCCKVLSLPAESQHLIKWEIDEQTIDACTKSKYATTMLFDIAQTCWLVESIIQNKIPSLAGETYYWIDLWTWSWILLDAQDICRQRNGFNNAINIWIDISISHVKRATEVLLQLWNSKIIQWDLTDSEIYKNLPQQKIHQITAELIGQPWVDVSMPEDPFHITMNKLFTILWEYIKETTSFLPEEFHMNMTIHGELKKILIWRPENVFFSDFILEIEKMKERNWKLSSWVKAEDIVIECAKIKLTWNTVKLEDIWKEYYLNGLVIQDLQYKPRRWVNQRKSLIDILLGTDKDLQIGITDIILENIVRNSIAYEKYFKHEESKVLIKKIKDNPHNIELRIDIWMIFLERTHLREELIRFLEKVPLNMLR